MKKSEISLYFGSNLVLEKPQKQAYFLLRDLGEGLICTDNLEFAKLLHTRFEENIFLSEFSLNIENKKILNFFDKKYSILNWVATIAKYRLRQFLKTENISDVDYLIQHFAIDVSEYDIVISPRTDNSNLDFIQSFLRSGMSLSTLKKFIDISEKERMITLINHDLADELILVKNEYVDAKSYCDKYAKADFKIRNKLKVALKHIAFERNALYLKDIVEEGIKDHDPRL